ncbi:MAG: tryptophan--tRNA ligase [Pyrinomonadaceae bacterium]|nr:tryptophan--tRNA ligase [Pyrinomonadaceae bacterium]
MRRLLSGVKPTGPIHLGNYIGALRNWLQFQLDYENFFFVADLHALTVRQDPKVLAERIREIARMFLAVGIDPQKSVIFVQSDVPEHSELTWLLNCVTRMGELERMTQFKDKAREGRERAGVGLFDYPVLMAADVLLYQTDVVPVGEDQKQHMELTRDLAIRFNRDYGETFRVPEPFIPEVGARLMSLSNASKKMSKSDDDPQGCIELLDAPDAITRKFKRAVTDSGTEIRFDPSRPAITNLLVIYQLLTNQTREEIETHFSTRGYAQLKNELAERMIEFLKPVQERFNSITDAELDTVLDEGCARARVVASQTLGEARRRLGVERKAMRSMSQ